MARRYCRQIESRKIIDERQCKSDVPDFDLNRACATRTIAYVCNYEANVGQTAYAKISNEQTDAHAKVLVRV